MALEVNVVRKMSGNNVVGVVSEIDAVGGGGCWG